MVKKDLRSIKKAKLNKDDIKKAAKKANVNTNVDGIKNDDIKGVEDTIKKYENKSEDELMGDLTKMISQGRKDGTYSDEMLDGFMKNVAPMMDKQQRKKMESIAKMLKMNKI